MSHYSYTEKRKDLRPLLDAICGWVEMSFCIGGIAWHKIEDLERRLSERMPEPMPHTQEAVKNLHQAWRYLREITDTANDEERKHLIDAARIFMLNK